MLTSQERYEWLPERSETVQMHSYSSVQPELYPPKELTLHYPSIEKSYERYTPNSDGSHHEWKPFEHYKVFAGPPADAGGTLVHSAKWGTDSHTYIGYAQDPYAAYRSFYLDFGYLDWFGDPGRLNYDLPAYLVDRPDGGFVPSPVGLSDYVAASLRKMLPSIKSELSLVNSLIELKDFASVPKTLIGVESLLPMVGTLTLRQMANISYKRLKFLNFKFTVPNASTVSHVGADTYLQYMFNIRPLLSDIAGIRSALSRTEKRINDLVTRSGRVRTSHYAATINEFPNDNTFYRQSNDYWIDSSFSEGWPLSGKYTNERVVISEPTQFHAEIEYNYNYTQYQLAHAQLLSLLDALGVNLNPAIIWNAIPWSFVVDWVLGVSRWLSQFTIANMAPKINISRFCYSIKRKRRMMCIRGISSVLPSYLPMGTRVRLPIVYESAYRRYVGLPTVSSIELSGLSSTEFSLGAALVIARRRHPHHRK